MFRIYGLFRFRSDGFRHYSTAVIPYYRNTAVIPYSGQDAISISSKGNIPHLKTTAKSELVVNTFKIYGLNNTQIKDIISYAPKILTCKPHKTLQPKLRVFQELGLSGSDLVSLVKNNPGIFECGLHRIKSTVKSELVVNAFKIYGLNNTQIKDIISYAPKILTCKPHKTLQPKLRVFQELGLSGSDLVSLVKNNPGIFECGLHTRIKSTVKSELVVNAFKIYGLNNTQIKDIISYAPKILTCKPHKSLQPKLRVFQELGLSGSDLVSLVKNNPGIFECGLHTRIKSTVKSELVVNTFKIYGLNNTQIKDIISYAPKILTCKPHKTVQPKLRVFQELGLSGSDLVSLVKNNPGIFECGLHTRIIPGLDLLKKLAGGSDENVIQIVKNLRWLYSTDSWMNRLSTNASILRNQGLLNENKYIHFVLFNTDKLTRISANVRLLRRYGVSDEKISKLLVENPKRMQKEPEVFESKMQYVEHKLGISPYEPNFIHGLVMVMYRGDAEIEKKKQVFRSFGWSDHEIASLIRSQPYCLNRSLPTITNKLNVFMKELGYTPSYLMGCPSFMTMSLEKRVKPRYEIYKMLKEKELLNEGLSLMTFFKNAEPQFLGFLKSFENHVPNLCETYMNSVMNSITK